MTTQEAYRHHPFGTRIGAPGIENLGFQYTTWPKPKSSTAKN